MAADVAMLFDHKDARVARHRTLDKGHGRVEERILEVALGLEGHQPVSQFLDWPNVAQAFKLTRIVQREGKTTTNVHFAITSVPQEQMSPKMALKTWREHWSIENSLHWVRDVTFDEDRSQVRTKAAPQAMAAIRNCAIAIFRLAGCKNIAASIRSVSWRPQQAIAWIKGTL